MEEGKKGSREPFGKQLQVSRKEMCHCHRMSSEHRRSGDNWRSWDGQDTDGSGMKVREWEVSSVTPGLRLIF